jgi:hypothetical protein
MRRVVSSSELVGACVWQGLLMDVSAHGDAYYEEATGTLEVRLTAEAEPADGEFHSPWPQPQWLPAKQTVREHLPYEDALEAAKEIFQNWARKVREAMTDGTETNQERRNL